MDRSKLFHGIIKDLMKMPMEDHEGGEADPGGKTRIEISSMGRGEPLGDMAEGDLAPIKPHGGLDESPDLSDPSDPMSKHKREMGAIHAKMKG